MARNAFIAEFCGERMVGAAVSSEWNEGALEDETVCVQPSAHFRWWVYLSDLGFLSRCDIRY
jgi:hypothetical protein